MSHPRSQDEFKLSIVDIKPGDIFYLDLPRLRLSQHPHYCVVLRVDAQKKSAFINFLSSEAAMFRADADIMIKATDKDFATTGLKHNTFYVCRLYAQVYVPISNLFLLRSKRAGHVSGEFKKRIEDDYGEKLYGARE